MVEMVYSSANSYAGDQLHVATENYEMWQGQLGSGFLILFICK